MVSNAMPDGGPSTLPIPSVEYPRNLVLLDDPPSSSDEDLSEDEGPSGPSPKKARLEGDIDKVLIETKEFEWSDKDRGRVTMFTGPSPHVQAIRFDVGALSGPTKDSPLAQRLGNRCDLKALETAMRRYPYKVRNWQSFPI